MKITARKSSDLPLTFDIEVFTDHPIFHDDMLAQLVEQGLIVASDVDLPKRPIITRDRKKLQGWMIDDFESFVERIEDFCELRMDLIGTYKNVSSDHSHYYNYLAKDDEGNIIVRIRMRLRISNHDPKRTKQQQHNKKQELQSEKLRELLTEDQIKKLDDYVLLVTVNEDKFDSYEEAYDRITERIERAVEIMKRKK